MDTPLPQEAVLAQTMVELADTLVDDFDVVELLTVLADRCVELFEVTTAGLMLVAPGGELAVVASSSEAMRVLEVLELQAEEGPCLDCFHTGEAILNSSLAASVERWPTFAPRATEAGFLTVHSLPMHLRSQVIGALNLFSDRDDELDGTDVLAAQAFADVATIAILQHRAITEAQLLNQQLNQALTSRIVIEQAKGVLAERSGIEMNEAFDRLRSYARKNNRRLVEVADEVIAGKLRADTLGP